MGALAQRKFQVHFLFLDYMFKHIEALSQKKTNKNKTNKHTRITRTEPKSEY